MRKPPAQESGEPTPGTPVYRRMQRVWIGTSGWVYKQWAGNFYPKGWPKRDEFSYYVRHFPTVEINATFYRLPSLSMVRGWHDRAPEGFVFAVKGSRFLTHMKRLTDTGPGLRKYFSRLVPLGDRTGPILWQLPPNFHKNEETRRRLEHFLGKLPKRHRHAVEFRHPSWLDEDTHALLRQHRAANVWLSSLAMPQDYSITTDFVYLRFHGLKDGAYHDYTADELLPWAKQLALAAQRDLPCYVYFNNDLNTRAPQNGELLMQMLGEHTVPAFHPEKPSPLALAPPIKGPETWPAWTRPRALSSGPPRRPPADRADREVRAVPQPPPPPESSTTPSLTLKSSQRAPSGRKSAPRQASPSKSLQSKSSPPESSPAESSPRAAKSSSAKKSVGAPAAPATTAPATAARAAATSPGTSTRAPATPRTKSPARASTQHMSGAPQRRGLTPARQRPSTRERTSTRPPSHHAKSRRPATATTG